MSALLSGKTFSALFEKQKFYPTKSCYIWMRKWREISFLQANSKQWIGNWETILFRHVPMFTIHGEFLMIHPWFMAEQGANHSMVMAWYSWIMDELWVIFHVIAEILHFFRDKLRQILSHSITMERNWAKKVRANSREIEVLIFQGAKQSKHNITVVLISSFRN